jgi:hypothetical protein
MVSAQQHSGYVAYTDPAHAPIGGAERGKAHHDSTAAAQLFLAAGDERNRRLLGMPPQSFNGDCRGPRGFRTVPQAVDDRHQHASGETVNQVLISRLGLTRTRGTGDGVANER